MEYWAELWNNFLDIISDHETELIRNPFIWVFIVLAGIGVYALYDVPDKVSQNGFGSVVRELLQVLLDTSSDIINALRSLTGFLSVVRLLLFGRINQTTLQILINYAIVFMSMASFTTTLAGLHQMAGNILGAFLSFGVQVSILICATKIAYCRDRINNEAEKIITIHQYRIGKMEFQNSENRKPCLDGETDDNKESNKEKKSRLKKISGRAKAILIISVFVSSGFSYSFMFGKFINPHLAYDDHFRSIREVQNIIREYSEELNQYRAELADVLTSYNDNIEELLDFTEDNPYIKLEQEKTLLEEISTLEDRHQDLETEYYAAEEDSPESNALASRIDTLEKEIEEKKGNLKDIQEELYEDPWESSRRTAYESIIELTDFYANPGEIDEIREKELRQNFTYLQQSEAMFQMDEASERETGIDDSKRGELANVFENYMGLSKFLSSQGGGRISFDEVQEKMGIDYSEDFSDDNYKKVTNDILIEMLNKLNNVPVLMPAKNVWSGEAIQAPPQTKYINTINSLYRDNSDKVLGIERAIRKLFNVKEYKEWGLCVLLLFLAVIFDGLIIALTMFREMKHSLTDNTELQRLIGVLFIDDSIGREAERQRKSQSLCLTLGFATGILTFTIYQAGSYNQGNTFEQNTFSLVCFIATGLILGITVYKLYCKIHSKLHCWEQENLYQQWKELFLPDEESEKRLKEKIEKLKNNMEAEKAKNIEDILAFWMGALGKRLFIGYFYPGFVLLFNEMEMKNCIKKSITKELWDGKYIDKEVLVEEINLPCLPEKKVAESGAKVEFSILKRRHLVEFAFEEDSKNEQKKGYYILTERFWALLYKAILLRIAGGRIREYDVEEELQNNTEEDE